MNAINQLIRFLVVGLLGFCIESTTIYFGIYILGLDPVSPRYFSLPLSMVVTWWINRVWSFKSKSEQITFQLAQYLIVVSVGAIINFLIYRFLVTNQMFEFSPIVSLLIAVFVSATFNFLVLRNFVFNTRSSV